MGNPRTIADLHTLICRGYAKVKSIPKNKELTSRQIWLDVSLNVFQKYGNIFGYEESSFGDFNRLMDEIGRDKREGYRRSSKPYPKDEVLEYIKEIYDERQNYYYELKKALRINEKTNIWLKANRYSFDIHRVGLSLSKKGFMDFIKIMSFEQQRRKNRKLPIAERKEIVISNNNSIKEISTDGIQTRMIFPN